MPDRAAPETAGVGLEASVLLPMMDDREPRLLGFHTVEESEGTRFRWSTPLSVIVATPPGPGRFEARLETLPVRPAAEAGLRVSVDGRPVPRRDVAFDGDIVRFPVAGGGPRAIGLVTKTLRPRRNGSPDHRDLGIAVRALGFRPY